MLQGPIGKPVMHSLAQKLRTLQFFSHAGHNNVVGPAFAGDHSLLGDLYQEYEKSYDNLVEFLISLDEETVSPFTLTMNAASALERESETSDGYEIFRTLSVMEGELRNMIVDALEELGDRDVGAKTLLEQLHMESRTRDYKIKQRIK